METTTVGMCVCLCVCLCVCMMNHQPKRLTAAKHLAGSNKTDNSTLNDADHVPAQRLSIRIENVVWAPSSDRSTKFYSKKLRIVSEFIATIRHLIHKIPRGADARRDPTSKTSSCSPLTNSRTTKTMSASQISDGSLDWIELSTSFDYLSVMANSYTTFLLLWVMQAFCALRSVQCIRRASEMRPSKRNCMARVTHRPPLKHLSSTKWSSHRAYRLMFQWRPSSMARFGIPIPFPPVNFFSFIRLLVL